MLPYFRLFLYSAAGRVFQQCGPANAKARSPNFLRHTWLLVMTTACTAETRPETECSCCCGGLHHVRRIQNGHQCLQYGCRRHVRVHPVYVNESRPTLAASQRAGCYRPQPPSPFIIGRIAVAYCYRRSVVCLSVCRSVATVSPAKTSEPIEMPFGIQTQVGPKNHVLDGGPDPHR